MESHYHRGFRHGQEGTQWYPNTDRFGIGAFIDYKRGYEKGRREGMSDETYGIGADAYKLGKTIFETIAYCDGLINRQPLSDEATDVQKARRVSENDVAHSILRFLKPEQDKLDEDVRKQVASMKREIDELISMLECATSTLDELANYEIDLNDLSNYIDDAEGAIGAVRSAMEDIETEIPDAYDLQQGGRDGMDRLRKLMDLANSILED